MNGKHSLQDRHINRNDLFYTVVQMFIIPYYVDETITSSSEFKLWKVWVFLAKGGTEVWETEEPCNTQETMDNYLTPNGFVGQHTFYKGSLYFKMDKSMDLSNLYNWKEFLEKAEDIPDIPVLRPLFWVGDKPGVKDDWGWSEQCSDVILGKYGSLEKLWDRIASVW